MAWDHGSPLCAYVVFENPGQRKPVCTEVEALKEYGIVRLLVRERTGKYQEVIQQLQGMLHLKLHSRTFSCSRSNLNRVEI